jgi:crotonobetainyl-CoA:carnitine CoA-transferase CaiB-like acyl-CoA transferase
VHFSRRAASCARFETDLLLDLGWGQVGTNAPRPAYDHVIQAATGMMSLQGDDPKAPPIKVGFPVIDIATGMSAAHLRA